MTSPGIKISDHRATSLNPPHLLTFDVEHWFEGLRHRGLSGWQNYPLRDDLIMDRVLDRLASLNQKATLFITGRYAEDFPQIVRRASQEGHEIASHSYAHLVFTKFKNLNEFREDVARSMDILENLSGKKVLGFRAPKWSIPDHNRQEALSVLADLGLAYDSSHFPQWSHTGAKNSAYRIAIAEGSSLWEVPATTFPMLGLRVPVAGGLYFRLFPSWVTHQTFSHCHRAGIPGMIYLHPYDIDAECPQPKEGGFIFRKLRYYGVSNGFDRLDQMLIRYNFSTVINHINALDEKTPQQTS